MTVILQLLFGFVQSVFTIGEKAFVVRLDVNGTGSTCAGSIITENAILTTAQCVQGRHPSEVTVVQFTPNGVHRHPVEAVFIHPNFCSVTLFGDVSIVKTQTKFHEPWKAIVVNDAGLRNSLKIYQNCNMVGWLLSEEGKSESRLEKTENDFLFDGEGTGLTRVFVSLITGEECSKKIKDFGGNLEGEEKLCGVCDQRKCLCSLGSGGPLLCLGEGRPPSGTVSKSLPMIGYEYMNRVSDRLDDPLDLLADFEDQFPAEERRRRDVDDVDGEYQMAIVSWGKICSKVPSVFVRTDSNYEWISSTVSLFDNRSKPIRTYTQVFHTISKSARPIHRVSFLLPICSLTFSCPAVFMTRHLT